ncbi:MAG: hemerythrin family protein [Planctomycetaceae bacterium]|jgi:hemerythrin|nr:hemerythrin family protein [Planctomycetaceae bacterium]
MAYYWTSDLEIGNALIDSEHQHLVVAVNKLLTACSENKGYKVLDKLLSFLVKYAAKHFCDEEKLQLECNYPNYTNHKKQHEQFKSTVHDLIERTKREGASTELVNKATLFVGDWLVSHIKEEDLKIGEHIHTLPLALQETLLK